MAVPAENLSVQLSREELAFLLFALKTDFIPGLDPEPLGNMDQNQKNLSLLFAERALRARDLVAVDDKGSLVVRETLMLMIATCAYSEMMISLHHFPSNSTPRRIFWHVRSGVIVSHTRPDAPLHLFSFLKDRATLEQQVLDGCNLPAGDIPSFADIITTNITLKYAREKAPNDKAGAAEALDSDGIVSDSAKEISHLLASDHSVSALHLAARRPDGTTLQESVTVLSGQSSSWLATQLEQDNVLLQMASRSSLLEVIQRWISSLGPWTEIPTL